MAACGAGHVLALHRVLRVRSAVPGLAAQAAGLRLGWTVGQGPSVLSYTHLPHMSPAHPLCGLSGEVSFRDRRGVCPGAACLLA